LKHAKNAASDLRRVPGVADRWEKGAAVRVVDEEVSSEGEAGVVVVVVGEVEEMPSRAAELSGVHAFFGRGWIGMRGGWMSHVNDGQERWGYVWYAASEQKAVMLFIKS